MGVLMSKKQQVEKVQKCSAVVSAFKDGLKDRAALDSVVQTEVVAENGDGSAEESHQPNTDQTEQKEKDDKPCSLSTQQDSALAKKEKQANQEAWGRLRDGKGVEPEELNKAHQLIPPAFVRPKREANDDQPVDVPLGQKEQPVNDEMCEVCEVWTADDLFPCRMCTRVFHDGCLREMGYLSTEALQEMRETAHTTTGWSCYYCVSRGLESLPAGAASEATLPPWKGCTSCWGFSSLRQRREERDKEEDGCTRPAPNRANQPRRGIKPGFSSSRERETHDNVNLLLTEEEMYSLMETFKQCKIIPESCLVSDELLQYRHFVTKQLFERDLTDEEEEDVLAQFAALDPDKKGQIEWSDFLYHETLSVLQKFRTENSLVRILTAKEKDRARAIFQSLDQDKDGIITIGEAKRAQTSWFHKINKDSQSCNVSISHVGPISESSPASSSSERSRDKALENDNRPVTWDNFLRESAIYILAARPNSSAMHIRLPL
ncbi:PHD finger protein 24-like isoform X2 [Myxocyprinus asiaticus]|uniref:PHD finger protein 24-like isoform X2 n=1 Tax=Myxocyprinus asiaticus TaxID=70543 RepID=UPI00222226DE|nr:PHD finger protein 24-like isoform X2 [Myxocyprinus asiaticus]